MTAPAPAEAPEDCPRCGRGLILSHDERSCIVHGLQFDPLRAWDVMDGPSIVPDERMARRFTWRLDERDRLIIAGFDYAFEDEYPEEADE